MHSFIFILNGNRCNFQYREEKSEAYIEVKEELEHKHSQYEKLRQEVRKLEIDFGDVT